MASGSHRYRWIGWALPLWILLILALGGAGWRVLEACGLAWVDGQPILTFCPEPAEPDPRTGVLVAERQRNLALEDELQRLRLAMIDAADCPVPPEPEPDPEPPLQIAQLDEPEPPPEPVVEPEPEPEPDPVPAPPGLPERRPDPPPLPPQPVPQPQPEPQPIPPQPQPMQPQPMQPQPPQQQPPPPPPPGPVSLCNTDMSAAGRHDDRRTVNLGTRGGIVTVDYDTVRVPDSIEVWYHGQRIVATPGMVSGRGRLQFFFTPIGNDPYVQVVVNSNRLFPTRWSYRVNCPR
ncbi:MAG: hypothetical protein H6843_06005 [Rhodospirillaceae bacterium]|nr:hypothetical protein [Rhodospirillaceae bacterium]